MGLKPLSDIEIIKIDSALRMFHLEILMEFFRKLYSASGRCYCF